MSDAKAMTPTDKYTARAREIHGHSVDHHNWPADKCGECVEIARALEQAEVEASIEALNNVWHNTASIGQKVVELRARLKTLMEGKDAND